MNMEDGNMEQLDYFSNKKVKIIFEDGKNPDGTEHYSKKEGWIIDHGKNFVIIENKHNMKEGINITKILRIEEMTE